MYLEAQLLKEGHLAAVGTNTASFVARYKASQTLLIDPYTHSTWAASLAMNMLQQRMGCAKRTNCPQLQTTNLHASVQPHAGCLLTSGMGSSHELSSPSTIPLRVSTKYARHNSLRSPNPCRTKKNKGSRQYDAIRRRGICGVFTGFLDLGA